MGCSNSQENIKDLQESDLINLQMFEIYNKGLVELQYHRYKNAYTCFSTGEKYGDKACMYELSIMYKKGLYVGQDEVKAKKLFDIAIDI